MKELRYVGPHDEVDVLGRVVARGETAKFTNAQAGDEPFVEVDEDGAETANPGAGLLAQPDNWQLVGEADD